MSKKTNKNNKKNVIKEIEKQEYNSELNLLNILRIVFIVLVVLAFFYLLTIAIVGNDSEEEKIEARIQYEEILAGSSFTMRDDKYLVVYFDFESEAAASIHSAVYAYSTSYSDDVLRVYTVDMSNGFNTKYVTEDESNKTPAKAQELAINGPTIIKIENGKAVEYIEGLDKILSYLK